MHEDSQKTHCAKQAGAEPKPRLSRRTVPLERADDERMPVIMVDAETNPFPECRTEPSSGRASERTPASAGTEAQSNLS